MKNQESPAVFNQKAASSYDGKWAKLAPTRDAPHFLIRVILSELPSDANIAGEEQLNIYNTLRPQLT